MLTEDKRGSFHPLVKETHYLAKRMRPDILTTVYWCALKTLKLTVEYGGKLWVTLYKGQDNDSEDRFCALAKSGCGSVIRGIRYLDAKSVSGAVILLRDAVIIVKRKTISG